MELQALQLVLADIEALGARVVAISPQVIDKSLETAENIDLSLDLLSDAGNSVTRQFGLVFTLSEKLQALYENIDLPAVNGNDSFELPIPATHIININSTIEYAFVEPDYFKRLEPSEIIRVLKDIQNSK